MDGMYGVAKPTIFQSVIAFLKTYWLYIAAVILLFFVWRWWSSGRSFNPKTPQDCSSCPGNRR